VESGFNINLAPKFVPAEAQPVASTIVAASSYNQHRYLMYGFVLRSRPSPLLSELAIGYLLFALQRSDVVRKYAETMIPNYSTGPGRARCFNRLLLEFHSMIPQ
jgi:hypothetical protein